MHPCARSTNVAIRGLVVLEEEGKCRFDEYADWGPAVSEIARDLWIGIRTLNGLRDHVLNLGKKSI